MTQTTNAVDAAENPDTRPAPPLIFRPVPHPCGTLTIHTATTDTHTIELYRPVVAHRDHRRETGSPRRGDRARTTVKVLTVDDSDPRAGTDSRCDGGTNRVEGVIIGAGAPAHRSGLPDTDTTHRDTVNVAGVAPL